MSLEINLETTENKFTYLEEKIKELETKFAETNIKCKVPCAKIEDELINCEYCDFKTTSKQGLKTHVKRKHTNYSKEIFPRKCDLCESEFKSNSDLTDHMKTHSYKCSSELNYKCEECEF